MKFIILAEGATERTCLKPFLKRWLDARIKQPAGVDIESGGGTGNFLSKALRKAQMHLDGPRQEELFGVIGLADIYGGQGGDPSQPVEQRCQSEKARIEGQVDRDCFGMFFAVHEVEAWLLACHTILPKAVQMELTSANVSWPERVDLSKPPASLLDHLYRNNLNRAHKKVVDGQNLFRNADPELAYEKCPHLREMLDFMLGLAQRIRPPAS